SAGFMRICDLLKSGLSEDVQVILAASASMIYQKRLEESVYYLADYYRDHFERASAQGRIVTIGALAYDVIEESLVNSPDARLNFGVTMRNVLDKIERMKKTANAVEEGLPRGRTRDILHSISVTPLDIYVSIYREWRTQFCAEVDLSSLRD